MTATPNPTPENGGTDAAEECFRIIGDSQWTFESNRESTERFREIIEAETARLREANAELLGALKELERIVSAHPSFQNEWTHAASAIGAARKAIKDAS